MKTMVHNTDKKLEENLMVPVEKGVNLIDESCFDAVKPSQAGKNIKSRRLSL